MLPLKHILRMHSPEVLKLKQEILEEILLLLLWVIKHHQL